MAAHHAELQAAAVVGLERSANAQHQAVEIVVDVDLAAGIAAVQLAAAQVNPCGGARGIWFVRQGARITGTVVQAVLEHAQCSGLVRQIGSGFGTFDPRRYNWRGDGRRNRWSDRRRNRWSDRWSDRWRNRWSDRWRNRRNDLRSQVPVSILWRRDPTLEQSIVISACDRTPLQGELGIGLTNDVDQTDALGGCSAHAARIEHADAGRSAAIALNHHLVAQRRITAQLAVQNPGGIVADVVSADGQCLEVVLVRCNEGDGAGMVQHAQRRIAANVPAAAGIDG
ncbi:hypothetical protein D3C75_778330 [compost metagenome]